MSMAQTPENHRDELVERFRIELLDAGLSPRNAFYMANEKYMQMKKLGWLPHQLTPSRNNYACPREPMVSRVV